MNRHSIAIFIVLIMTAATFAPAIGSVIGGTTTFKEEFEDGSYRSGSTTAAGWTDGNITLPHLQAQVFNTHWTGLSPYNFDIDGDLFYLATNWDGLYIYNISDKTSFSYLDSYDTGDTMYDVDADGDIAIAGEWGDVRFFDVSDPADIRYLSAPSFTVTSTCYDVEIIGDWAFASSGSQGLYAINITDPYSAGPRYLHSISSYLYEFEIDGGIAYLADSWDLEIVNISDPTNMVSVTQLYPPGTIRQAEVDGNVLYVGSYLWTGSLYEYYLTSYNVTDPWNPVYMDRLTWSDTDGWAIYDMDVDGNFLYVSIYYDGWETIDISDPSDLRMIWQGSDLGGWSSRNLEKEGMYLYVTGGDGGIHLYQVAENITPTKRSTYNGPGTNYDVFLDGDIAYVADGGVGLTTVDISDPRAIKYAGNYNTAGTTRGLWVGDDHAFIADGAPGLHIINVSDPWNPFLEGNYNSAGSAWDVTVRMDKAFIADYNNGLVIVNVSDTGNIAFEGGYDTAGQAHCVDVQGNVAYIADGGNGVVALNITDTANPTLMDTFSTTDAAVDIVVSGDRAYVAANTSGFVILDISDPANIVGIDTYDTPGVATDISVYGDHVYIADMNNGLVIVNVSDPWNIVRLDGETTLTSVFGVDNDGNFTYLANGGSGLTSVEVYDTHSETYDSSAWAFSLTVDTTPDPIVAVTVWVNDTKPAGTNVYYNISNDWGSTWYPVTPGTLLYFTVHDSGLRWRAQLVTTDQTVTPIVHNVTMDYYFDDVPPTSAASSPDYDNSGAIPVTYTANDPFPATGLDEVYLYYRLDANMDGDFVDVSDVDWTYTMIPSQSGASGTFYFNPVDVNGNYEFFTYAVDNNSIGEPVFGADDSTIFDNVRPTSNCIGGTPAFQAAGNIIVYYNASDIAPGSGLKNVTLWYRYDSNADGDFIDAGDTDWAGTGLPPQTAKQGSFTFNPGVSEGVYEFFTVARDNATNMEQDFPVIKDTYTTYDGSPPSTGYFLSGPLTWSGWYMGAVDVFLGATDGVSGVANTYYRVDGGSWSTYVVPFKVSGDGSHTIDIYSVDNAGNIETVQSFGIDIDTTDPDTGPAVTGTLGNNGWYVSSVVVDLDASDADSGVNVTRYRTNNGPWTDFTTALTLTSDGEYDIDYYSIDNATNEEGMDNLTVKLDMTKPGLIYNITGSEHNGWYNSPVTVGLMAWDDTSGLSGIVYRFDQNDPWTNYALIPISVDGEGEHALEFTAGDQAGNIADIETVEFGIDMTAPATDHIIDEEMGNDGWYLDIINIELVPSDALSGVEATYFRLDKGEWKLYEDLIYISDPGEILVEFYSVDIAGNKEDIVALEIKIDFMPPSIGYSITSSEPHVDGIYPVPVTVTVYSEDDTSGVGPLEFRMAEDDDWAAYKMPLFLGLDGNYTIYLRAVDVAGNINEFKTYPIILDLTVPEVKMAIEGEMVDDWYNTEVKVRVSGSDHGSGVGAIHYRIDEGEWQDFDGAEASFVVDVDGKHTVEAYVVDKVGHESVTVKRKVWVDTTPPLLDARIKGKMGKYGIFIDEVTFTVDILGDDSKGDITVEYQLDDGIWKQYEAAVVIRSEGDHTIMWKGVDQAGNEGGMGSINWTTDLTPPVITLGKEAKVVATETTDVEGTTEPGAKVTYDGKDVTVGTDGRFTLSVALIEGENVIEAQAEDRAGHTARTKVTITRDMTPPTVALTSPGQDTITLEDTIRIEGSTDPDATVTVNDKPVPVDEFGSFVLTVPLVIGPNTITIKASDPYGNEIDVTRDVERQTKRKQESEATFTQVLPWFMIILVILAIVATMLGFMIGRKGRRKDDIEADLRRGRDDDMDRRHRREPREVSHGGAVRRRAPRAQSPEPEDETSFEEFHPDSKEGDADLPPEDAEAGDAEELEEVDLDEIDKLLAQQDEADKGRELEVYMSEGEIGSRDSEI